MLAAHTYIDAVDSGGRIIAEVVERSPDASVRACPGWTLTDLAAHLGSVYRFVASLLADPIQGPPSVSFPTPPATGVLEWFAHSHTMVLEGLRATSPDTPMWTWTARNDAGFYHRRQAHETFVHRLDAELAVGEPGPVDGELAVDAIREVLDVGYRHSLRRPTPSYPQSTLHLHRTDGNGEWLLRAVDGELVVTEEHAKGDAAVRGTGTQLLLYLWGRGREGCEVFGSPDVADAWSALAP